MKIEKVKIESVKPNKDNPRTIDPDKLDKLVQSIKDFPEMLKIRPIVVDDKMVVLGGNQRLKACEIAGLKEIHIINAKSLTAKQQAQFIIKDNIAAGEWDWDDLLDEWPEDDLEAWGLDTPPPKSKPSTKKFIKIEVTASQQPKLKALISFWEDEQEGDVAAMLYEKLKSEQDNL